MIYLDNAATTRPKPPEVVKAVVDAMQNFGLLGPEDHVISTDLEHNSVLRPLARLEKTGTKVSYLPADRNGQIALGDLEKVVEPNTKAVVCTHGSNVTGDLVDITRVGEFCQSHGLLFILDASQTAGVFPIDITKQHIDVVCFTGHKSLLGPQGTGGLCFREGLDIKPWKTGGTGVQSFLREQPSQYPTRLEAGTLNGHGLAGLHAALKLRLATGLEVFREHELTLARKFYEGIKTLPSVRIYGNFATKLRAPIVTFNIGDVDAAQVSDELDRRFGIATRPGAHCAPRLHKALGTVEQGAVRFSWSWANTEEETAEAIKAVKTLVEEYK